ncbi:hypothetical protein E2C01_069983 [Portunus trituberculatus]|uniref:Uncharacterized protein n=1 Tax=Portunus trituberculatus TaxID=210409 RepID=A0A5B7I023_PORTR|nr:hypothetical protein [Portunus trituberculatus]
MYPLSTLPALTNTVLISSQPHPSRTVTAPHSTTTTTTNTRQSTFTPAPPQRSLGNHHSRFGRTLEASHRLLSTNRSPHSSLAFTRPCQSVNVRVISH